MASRGKWEFEDGSLVDTVRKIINVQREFWRDHSQKYYLVTLVPLADGNNSYSFGGTGLTDSFALFATPNATIDKIKGLIAHEYAHNWIAPKLGRMPDPEQQLYWFSEGFTEFYTLRLLLRGEIISDEEFVAAYNERIREYYLLPVKSAGNDRIVKEFWTAPNVQRLPYLRGFLFATNLNAEIENLSNGKYSLDDVMHELFEASKGESPPLSFQSLATVFSKYLGRDSVPIIQRFIIDGDMIEPVADGLGPDFGREMVTSQVFELGFDFDKLAKDRIVANVKLESAAYAAGLRDGQVRVGGFSVFFGDTTREIELKVRDNSGDKIVRFHPVAKERIILPQYRSR